MALFVHMFFAIMDFGFGRNGVSFCKSMGLKIVLHDICI